MVVSKKKCPYVTPPCKTMGTCFGCKTQRNQLSCPNLYSIFSRSTNGLAFWAKYYLCDVVIKCVGLITHLCRNPTLRECEDETHTPEMGTWESSNTPKTSEFDYRSQNTSHWGVIYIIGKLSKSICRKWGRMSHLDICSTSFGKKKGRESKCQFDSQPLKVRNRPDPDVLRESSTHHWKALDKSYNFALDLVPIRGLSKKLWSCKVAGVQTVAVSRLLLGSPRTKSHSNVGAVGRHKEYYMEEGGGFPQVQGMVSLVSLELLTACPSTEGVLECDLTNLLVGLMQV